MSKLISLLLFIGIIGSLGFYILKNYAPDLIPPSKNIKQYLPLNSETLSPLKIPSGYKMDLFADLRNQRAKVFAIDSKGTLYASITSFGKVIAVTDYDGNLKSEGNVEIISGLSKPFGLAFNGNYLYLAESGSISRYLYNDQDLSVISKELLIQFPKNEHDTTRNIHILDDKLYFTNGNFLMSSNLDGSDIKTLENLPTEINYFAVGEEENIWKSGYYGIILDRDNNLLNILPGKIVKLSVYANGISGQEDFISGFIRGDNEELGKPVDLILDSNNNLFIADDKTGLIYVLIK